MSSPVNYTFSDKISEIVMDDGKVNAVSLAMVQALNQALDQAEKDGGIVLLTGRPGIFSAGFHLKEIASSPENMHALLRGGATLAHRILSHPLPVVTACTGHAYPMGAFLMMAADFRYGVEGDFKIGMNEVAIGMTIPHFALELARGRLTPAHFNRTAMTGEMFGPEEAVKAGFLDELTAPADLRNKARAKCAQLTQIDLNAHKATKQRARKQWLENIQTATDDNLTLENAQASFG